MRWLLLDGLDELWLWRADWTPPDDARAWATASLRANDADRSHDPVRAEAVTHLLRACVASPSAMRRLRALAADEGLAAPGRWLADADLVDAVRRQVHAGQLVLGFRHVLHGSPSVASTHGSVAPPPPRPERREVQEILRSATGPSAPPQVAPSAPTAPGAPIAAPTDPAGLPLDIPQPLSTYEVVLLDERDEGIGGVWLSLGTPGQYWYRPTDGSGRLFVEEPPGVALLRIGDKESLRQAMRERADRPKRRTPLPSGDDPIVVTVEELIDSAYSFPDAVTKRFMVVSRVDVTWSAVGDHWGRYEIVNDAAESGRLYADGDVATLQAVADGSGAKSVIGLRPMMPLPPPEPRPAPPPLPNTLWPDPLTCVALAGDTIAALAARYLGDVRRAEEILALNEGRLPESPLRPGELVTMPPGAMPAWMSDQQAVAAVDPPIAAVDAPSRLVVDADALHRSLFAQDFAAIEQELADALGVPPRPTPPAFPPPMAEAVEYRNALLVLALQGHVDPPYVVVEHEK